MPTGCILSPEILPPPPNPDTHPQDMAKARSLQGPGPGCFCGGWGTCLPRLRQVRRAGGRDRRQHSLLESQTLLPAQSEASAGRAEAQQRAMSKLTSAPRAHLGEFPGPSKPWFSYLKRDKAGIRRLLLLELTEITGELASLGPTTHRSLRGPGRPPQPGHSGQWLGLQEP